MFVGIMTKKVKNGGLKKEFRASRVVFFDRAQSYGNRTYRGFFTIVFRQEETIV